MSATKIQLSGLQRLAFKELIRKGKFVAAVREVFHWTGGAHGPGLKAAKEFVDAHRPAHHAPGGREGQLE